MLFRFHKLRSLSNFASLSTSLATTASMESAATTSRMLQPPDLGGMTRLDRSRFTKMVELPYLRVPTSIVGRIIGLKSMKAATIQRAFKASKLRPIMECADSAAVKLAVFDPDALAQIGRERLLADIRRVAPLDAAADDSLLTFGTMCREFGYADWDVKSCLRAILPAGLDFSSYANVGHIAHLNLREEILPYKFIIAEILLDKVANVKTVVNKLNAIDNEFRFFEMELLAGVPEYTTTVVEQGIRYRFDFSKVFWNSRLTRVHDLIIRRCDERSVLFDIFAGVGPFVIPAVRLKNAQKCFANDLNPESVKYLRENVALNKIPAERIEVFNMDGAEFIRKVIPEKIAELAADSTSGGVEEGEGADGGEPTFHALMNLPCLAVEFLKYFRGCLTTQPQTREYFEAHVFLVHCHLFVKAAEEQSREWFVAEAEKMVRDRLGLPHLQIQETTYIRRVAPMKDMFCVTFRLSADYAFSTTNVISAGDGEPNSSPTPTEGSAADGGGGGIIIEGKEIIIEEGRKRPAVKRNVEIVLAEEGPTTTNPTIANGGESAKVRRLE